MDPATSAALSAATRERVDWRQVAVDTEALNVDLAAACRAGVVPGSAEANALAERHRESFSRYFDCTHAMHACLARTFVTEPGYTEPRNRHLDLAIVPSSPHRLCQQSTGFVKPGLASFGCGAAQWGCE
jgi:hypothetical protein